jgi:Trypsin
MFNFKSCSLLAAAALTLIMAAPVAEAAGMPAKGNFVSVRINGTHAVYGVILSPTKILVPAHAVGGALTNYSVLAGSPDTIVTTCATCQLRSVSTVVRHPSYNSSTMSNDVAIIRVPALTFNTNIFGSTIAASFSNAIGTQFTQIGYGTGGANHNRLQTTVTAPWTLVTMSGYVYTPGDFLTASTDTSLNGMISYYSNPQKQVYTKLSDYATWINAN